MLSQSCGKSAHPLFSWRHFQIENRGACLSLVAVSIHSAPSSYHMTALGVLSDYGYDVFRIWSIGG